MHVGSADRAMDLLAARSIFRPMMYFTSDTHFGDPRVLRIADGPSPPWPSMMRP